MNIFSEIGCAFSGARFYPEFLKNRRGKVFFYAVMLVLIYAIIAQLNTIPNTFSGVSEIKDTLQLLPDFEMENGMLYMDETFQFDEFGALLVIEPQFGPYLRDYTTAEWRESLEGYEYAIIMDQTSILISGDGELDIYDYPENLSFSRDDISNLMDLAYVIVFVYIVLFYLFSVCGYFFGALPVALVGLIICSFSKKKLTFGQIYTLSIYAKTLPLLMKGILKLASMSFFGYSVIAFVIACAYLRMAVHYMEQQDVEKRQIANSIIS